MARLAHAQESAGSSGGQDGVPTAICWARRKHGRASRERTNVPDLKCSRHICAKHGSAGQCAWLASTGPSHGRGPDRQPRGTYPGQQPRRHAGERETACCQEEDAATERAEAKRALERSRRSSSATATRLVAEGALNS